MEIFWDELRRLASIEERHRRLAARLMLVVVATVAIDLVGSAAMYLLERDAHGTQIRTVGQALFFTTVQLLTVSSQVQNPVTPVGRVVDVVLELWAVIVVAGSAGAIASFFQSDGPS
jgi:voltage-gated potassium channel